jgi:hypothetical protein
MDTLQYLDKFKKAVDKVDKKLLAKKQLEIDTGIWLDSVVLRLQKKHWANNPSEKPHSGSAIFFSVWLTDQSIKDNRILYNIHALKLRQLNGYTITSREFAAAFREKFIRFEQYWPNISVDHGPQTLIQGWKKTELEQMENNILELANKFLEIDVLIDELLTTYKSPNPKNRR